MFSEEKFKFAIRFFVASVSVKDSNDVGFCLFVCLFLLLLFFGASGLTFAPYLNEECNYQSC